jgi:hypothetical protein
MAGGFQGALIEIAGFKINLTARGQILGGGFRGDCVAWQLFRQQKLAGAFGAIGIKSPKPCPVYGAAFLTGWDDVDAGAGQ